MISTRAGRDVVQDQEDIDPEPFLGDEESSRAETSPFVYNPYMHLSEKKGRVLIVEDEPLIGAALEEFLVDQGYDVPRIIDTVESVLPAVRDCRPDLILMDIKLRSFNDGIDATHRLRLLSSIPVVFLTAYTDEATRKRAEGITNTVFLGKPLDESQLSREIARLLA
jgi:two-component system, response regulator PdtaR